MTETQTASPYFNPPPAEAPEQEAPALPPGFPEGAHLMPSGNWVMMADPKALTRGDKKALIRSVRHVEDDEDKGYGVIEGLLAKLITAWSYPSPIPSQDPAAMDEIPVVDDGPLMELAEEARALLFPSPVTPDDHADERSPTEPSGE